MTDREKIADLPFTLDAFESLLYEATWCPTTAYIGAGLLAIITGLSTVIAGLSGALVVPVMCGLMIWPVATGPFRRYVFLSSKRVVYIHGFAKRAHFLPLEKIDSVRAVGTAITISSGKFSNSMTLSLSDANEFLLALEQARSLVSGK